MQAKPFAALLFLGLLLFLAASIYAAETGGTAPAQPLRAGNSFAEATPLVEGTYEFTWSDKDNATKKYLALEPKSGSQLNLKLVSKLPKDAGWMSVTSTLYNEKHESVQRLAYQSLSRGKPAPLVEAAYAFSAEQTGTYYLMVEETSYEKEGGTTALTVSFSMADDAGSGRDAASDFSGAVPLTPGTHKSKLIYSNTNPFGADKADMYSIPLNTFDKLTVTVTPDEKDNGAFTIQFYDNQRVKSVRASAANRGASVTVSGLASQLQDPYYFSVSAYNGGAYTVDVQVENVAPFKGTGTGADATQPPAQQVTPGKNFTDAPLIQAGTYQLMWPPGDESTRFFKIEAVPARAVTLELFMRTADQCDKSGCRLAADIVLYDESREAVKTLLAEEETITQGTDASKVFEGEYNFSAEETGTYYLAVTNNVGGSAVRGARMTVSFGDASDAGSGKDAPAAFDGALELKPGTYKANLIAGCCGRDETDTYAFNLGDLEKLEVKVTPEENGQFGLAFYDGSRNRIDYAGKEARNKGAIVSDYVATVKAKKVYFRVFRGEQGGSYSLDLKISKVDPCDLCNPLLETCSQGKCVLKDYGAPVSRPSRASAGSDPVSAFFAALFKFLSGWFGGGKN